jgi:hypothetical protein
MRPKFIADSISGNMRAGSTYGKVNTTVRRNIVVLK